MLQALWRLSGLDRQLALLKATVERKATEATNQVKAAAVRFVLALCFIVAALAFVFMALVTGLIALYTWLETMLGPLPALGILAGVLIGVALIFIITALVVGRGRSQPEPTEETAAMPLEPPPAMAPGLAAAGYASPSPPPADDKAAAELIEPFLLLVKRFATRPRTGTPLLDDVIAQVTPAAEGAADDVVNRAATLVRTGDRTTMIAVLSASAMLGWLLVKAGDWTSDPA
ncbi:MAG: hypothetical protein R3D62_21775 [Xanthobacteraceae bacterium]